MFDEHLLEKIPIDSVTITNRARRDFGNIQSLAESINTVELMQPVVINENKKFVDVTH
jgi:ParB-like chromosome segregation protein Spo0J